jgi:hypothetical protein
MNILETHIHHLRFKLDEYAPEEYIKRWINIKKTCENSDNEDYAKSIINNCKILSNKNLPYLKRCEGGIGGDNNQTNKQIRFIHSYSMIGTNYNNIVLTVLDSDLGIEKWTYAELDDIVHATIKVLNKEMQTKCVNGCIEMIDRETFWD